MGSFLSTPWDPQKGIPDLRGKVAIVTGANAGIGYEVTVQLVRHGAKVYLAARNEGRAAAAIKKIYATNPQVEKGKLTWLPLDLEDVEKVAEAARTILDKEDRLDILVNNAGMAAHSFQTTSKGFEVTVGVNHLGHFLFTVNLLPLLKRTAAKANSDVRIVTVSSSAHAVLVPAKMQFDKLDDLKFPGVTSSPNFTGMRDLFARYAVSKVANILFAKELQRRLDAEEVRIISTTVNPGGISTEGGLSVWPSWMRPIMRMMMAPASRGALPILYLACEPELKRSPSKYAGLYYNASCKPEKSSSLSQDKQVAENLWKISEEAVAPYINK